MWMLLAAIAGGATPSDDQRLDSLARAFEAQSAQVSELSRRVDMQRAEIAELRADQTSRPSTKASAGVRASVSASGGPDRQLTEAAQSRSMWHETIYHTFEDPSSLGCDLPADASVGPIDMRRMADGTIATKYKTTAGSSTVAPMVLTHPPGCENATLHLQMDTTVPHLVVGGFDVAAALVELGCRTDGTGCIPTPPTPPTSPPTSPPPATPFIEGVQSEVSYAALVAGHTCVVQYSEPYIHATTRGDVETVTTPEVEAGKPYSYAILGARYGSSTTGSFKLAAVGDYADVFTPTVSHDTHLNRGTYWYYRYGSSMGFSQTADVQLNSADTSAGPLRMSWHLGGGSGGYRAGESKGNDAVALLDLYKVVMYCH